MVNKKKWKITRKFICSFKGYFQQLERHYFHKLIEIDCGRFVDINLKLQWEVWIVFLGRDKTHLCYHLIYFVVGKLFINFFQNLLKMSPFINYVRCKDLKKTTYSESFYTYKSISNVIKDSKMYFKSSQLWICNFPT